MIITGSRGISLVHEPSSLSEPPLAACNFTEVINQTSLEAKIQFRHNLDL